jgi:hypothetical protein
MYRIVNSNRSLLYRLKVKRRWTRLSRTDFRKSAALIRARSAKRRAESEKIVLPSHVFDLSSNKRAITLGRRLGPGHLTDQFLDGVLRKYDRKDMRRSSKNKIYSLLSKFDKLDSDKDSLNLDSDKDSLNLDSDKDSLNLDSDTTTRKSHRSDTTTRKSHRSDTTTRKSHKSDTTTLDSILSAIPLNDNKYIDIQSFLSDPIISKN